MTLTARFATLAVLLAAGACVPRAEPQTPAPRPAPRPQAVPVPPPPTAPIASGWLQAPLEPGRWTYRAGATGTTALWGEANEGARFAFTCDRASRTVRFTRAGAIAGPMEIRTTNGARTFDARADADLPGATASVPAGDDFLNGLVFSRGRFLVSTSGAQPLIPATWAEPFRVIEDCRR